MRDYHVHERYDRVGVDDRTAGLSVIMMALIVGAIALVLVVAALAWRPWNSGTTVYPNNNPVQQQQQQQPSESNPGQTTNPGQNQNNQPSSPSSPGQTSPQR